MTGEIVPFSREIDTTRFNVAREMGKVLGRGLFIRTSTFYKDHRYVRTATIFDTHEPGFHAVSYGTGSGPIIEKAVIRALYVNKLSRDSGGRHPDSYPEGEHGPIRPKITGRSQLDHIYDDPDEEVWVYKNEEGVVAESQRGQGVDGENKLIIVESDPLCTFDMLAVSYNFLTYSDRYMDSFPPTLFPSDNK